MTNFLFVKVPMNFELSISRYRLKFKNRSLTPLQGALLAFDFDSGLRGYSDFLPWPSFGEQELSQHLEQVRKGGVFSQRFLLAKHNAFLDARARQKKRNLFFGLKIPPSHYLIEDLLSFNQIKNIRKGGFQAVKVKLKAYKIPEQIQKIKALHLELGKVKWRFDLNGQDWLLWKEKLSFINMDFVEDPLVHRNPLKEERKLLAQDWMPSPHFQIKIVKASRDSVKDLLRGLASSRWKRLVFTHSFDHPLGQAVSAFWAGFFYRQYPHWIETGAFLNFQLEKLQNYKLESKGDTLIAPQGFGFGFGDSLKKEKWERYL